MSTNSEPFSIDIVSDVACPWCYVGKKKLELALQTVGDQILPRFDGDHSNFLQKFQKKESITKST